MSWRKAQQLVGHRAVADVSPCFPERVRRWRRHRAQLTVWWD
jgi:hypothetical protein